LHHPNKINRNEIKYRKKIIEYHGGEKNREESREESSGRKQKRERPSRETRTGNLVGRALSFPRSHIRWGHNRGHKMQ
jgi:hypothetical protein